MVGRRGEKPQVLRVALVAILVLATYAIVLPESTQNVSAVYPRFNRPSVKIDKGPGSVGAGWAGGPDIASDEHGVLHAVWSDNRSGYDEGIYYAHSYDGGATWLDEKRIDYYQGLFNSAPHVEVDTSGGPHSGNIYVAWQFYSGSMAEIYVIMSTDGGLTWTNKHRIDSSPSNIGSQEPVIAVDLNGVVYVAFADNRWGTPDIFVARSDDGGVTWSTEVKGPSGGGYDFAPDLVAYGGTVYLLWEETSVDGAKVWLATTIDKGQTWTSSVVSSIPGTEGDALSPSLAVGPNGVLHVAWISRDNRSWSFVVYSRSVDNGATWSRPVYVSDAYPDMNITQNHVTMLVSLDVLYIVWTENKFGDYDIFASWSENGGGGWGDGLLNGNDIRVDDTDANGVTSDDESTQYAPSAAPGPAGIYVVWSDRRDLIANHLYFASFNPSEILVTEVRDGPDGQEQVEIHNPLKKPADISGWGMFVDGVRIDLTPLSPVPAGGYRTIGDPLSSDLKIDITLRDEGGSVLLLNRWDYYKDSVSYGQVGLAPDPLDGESIWRVPSVGASDSSWTRAPIPSMGGANGGRLPVVNSEIVLNEVYFNGANPSQLFVELYYRGKKALNLSGYTLVGDSAYVLPSAILKEGRRLYAVRPSKAPSLFSMINPSGDNLYLYDPSGSLVDMVGWSSPHTQGFSMSRVPDGNGTATGYNDATSMAAGWRFNQVPSPPRILIGPDQSKSGDPGESMFYALTVTNEDYTGAYVNIEKGIGPQGWAMTLLKADGVSLLADSPGDPDAIPDVGFLQPSQSASIQVRIDIPQAPPSDDWEDSNVKATSSSDPQATATAFLSTYINPYLQPEAFVDPEFIWVESAPPSYQPKEASVSLSVAGRGNAIVSFTPQDTVLMIDSSGSMENNDPMDLRLYASKLYVDILSEPDRAAVVDFDNDAVLVNGEHLTSDYTRIKSNIDLIDHRGWTNLSGAIRVATDELMQYGNRTHVYTEILLTDGADTMGNPPMKILNEAKRAAAAGIVIYTIGLLNSQEVDEQILKDIASTTGGRYLAAWRPEDLAWIYQAIGTEVKSLAGYDRDITDFRPMVNVFLPSHINFVPGSAGPSPSYIKVTPTGTNIQWNVSRINVGERWWAHFGITSEVSNPSVLVLSYPETRLTYTRYDDTESIEPFPITTIEVRSLQPPPSVRYTITRNPEMGSVTVDGVDYPSPSTFTWVSGERHRISAPDTEPIGPTERFAFSKWDDSGGIVHDVTVGNSDMTITAIYSHQFKPDVTLLGLDVVHTVSTHFYSRMRSTKDVGVYDRWSNWVDDASGLYFDLVGTNNATGERRITLEDFGRAPWSSVRSSFSRTVSYWHQVKPSVSIEGLPESHATRIVIMKFGSQLSDACWNSWSDWLDYGSILTIQGRVDVASKERYVNLVSKDLNVLEWVITNAEAYFIPFVHQFKPSVQLQGLDDGNGVSAHFASARENLTQAGLYETWSDWVDEGSALHFDVLSSASNSQERWVTREDFVNPPWSAVDSPFQRVVKYWHQYRVSLRPEGLPSHLGLPITFVQFGIAGGGVASGEWAGWLDASTILDVAGRISPQPGERFINKIRMNEEYLEWTITSPATYVVPFLHQFKPVVHLIGTDSEHTVNVSYTDSTVSQIQNTYPGLSGQWSGWVDDGARLEFSDQTTGEPSFTTTDQTAFVVIAPFVAHIEYGLGESPPVIEGLNLKPLISMIFVTLLVVVGILCGYRRPLDRFIPPPDQDLTNELIEKRAEDLRRMPIEKKIEALSVDELRCKFIRDRRTTIALLTVPVAVVEGLTGIGSLFTGALRVPQEGSWFCVGLIVNSILLMGGITYELCMQRYGYRVPGDQELALMKSARSSPTGASSNSLYRQH